MKHAVKGAKGSMTKLEEVAHSALRSRVGLSPDEHEVYDKLRAKHLGQQKRKRPHKGEATGCGCG